MSHVAGTKSLELATPLVQAPYDVLRNNIGRLSKRSKWEKHGRSQSNHPLAKDPALVEMMVRHWAHVHGVCDSLGQCRHFPQETSKSSGHIEFDYLQSDRHLRKRRWHPLALGGSRHVLGMCPGNPETGKADCVR